MGKLALLLFLGIVSPALGVKQVTVAQVEQSMLAMHGKRDGAVAKRLLGLELTERVSSPRLARWETNFPGNHTREALIALADQSAFLDLPAAEIPAIAPPEAEAQELILLRTIDYVKKTLPKLPNFFATRNTTRFQDADPKESFSSNPVRPPANSSGNPQIEYQPLRFAGESSIVVTYRDGHEIDARAAEGDLTELPVSGLTTVGEFGPILDALLRDAVQSKIIWSHWEQGATGLEAVFRYEVPQEKSHYVVLFPFEGRIEQQSPAYHGKIAIDPATGVVLRLTMESDLKPPYQMTQGDILVEYGPVAIGAKTYICPVRGAAFSKDAIPGETGTVYLRTFVNDVSFEDYHVFRSQSRILAWNNVKAVN